MYMYMYGHAYMYLFMSTYIMYLLHVHVHVNVYTYYYALNTMYIHVHVCVCVHVFYTPCICANIICIYMHIKTSVFFLLLCHAHVSTRCMNMSTRLWMYLVLQRLWQLLQQRYSVRVYTVRGCPVLVHFL